MLKSKEMLLGKSVLISEEPSFPAKFGGEAEEDLHHSLLCLPHLFLLLASVQVFVFVLTALAAEKCKGGLFKNLFPAAAL